MQEVAADATSTAAPDTLTTERDALKQDLYALAYYLLRSANTSTFNAIAELDLSFTQIKALCALDSDGDERSVGWLAETLGTSLPAMSRAVDGLFERGLVGREEDPTDRRMKRVRLTPAGREVPEAMTKGRLTALSELIESFDEDEVRALGAALGPIVQRRVDLAAYRPGSKGDER